jgi:LacI family transcriptional regulator
MESCAQSRGYTTIVCDYRDDWRLLESKLDFLLSKRVDGVIAVPCRLHEPSLAVLAARRFPLVLFDRLVARAGADAVVIDNEEASRAAVSHLLESGHRRVGIIVGPRTVHTAVRRLAGYRAALRSFGLEPERGLVRTGDYTVAGGHRAMLALLASRPRPTAVYVTNYEMTLGAIVALNEKGVSLPRDLSFVGFDSQELAAIVKPQLTIVTQPLESIAGAAADLLLRRMGGDWEGFPQTVRFRADLQPRRSVARVRNGAAR